MLHEMMSIIDENSDKFSDGDYLKLCNYMLDLNKKLSSRSRVRRLRPRNVEAPPHLFRSLEAKALSLLQALTFAILLSSINSNVLVIYTVIFVIVPFHILFEDMSNKDSSPVTTLIAIETCQTFLTIAIMLGLEHYFFLYANTILFYMTMYLRE